MISGNWNVSAYDESPPAESDDRKIADGPLYEPDAVVALASEDNLAFWSRGAIQDAEKWELNVSDACRLIELAVEQGQYLGAEWCLQKPGGPWAACDAYKTTLAEWVETAQQYMAITYYLKFCISKKGTVLLSVSNHPEGT